MSEAFLPLIGFAEATGMLRVVYKHLPAPPPAYQTPSGEVANIIRAHSLDPDGLRLAFSWAGAVHWGPRSLPWPVREMMNTVTSRANHCFY
jgi:hypothetical protein